VLESSPALFWGSMFLAFVLLVTIACIGGVALGLWLWKHLEGKAGR